EMTGKKPGELTDAQRDELDKVGARQGEAAKELSNLEAKMDDLSRRLEESDPIGASALRDAAQQSRQAGRPGRLNAAAAVARRDKGCRGGARKQPEGPAPKNQKEGTAGPKEAHRHRQKPPRVRARPAGQGAEAGGEGSQEPPRAPGPKSRQDPPGRSDSQR